MEWNDGEKEKEREGGRLPSLREELAFLSETEDSKQQQVAAAAPTSHTSETAHHQKYTVPDASLHPGLGKIPEATANPTFWETQTH